MADPAGLVGVIGGLRLLDQGLPHARHVDPPPPLPPASVAREGCARRCLARVRVSWRVMRYAVSRGALYQARWRPLPDRGWRSPALILRRAVGRAGGRLTMAVVDIGRRHRAVLVLRVEPLPGGDMERLPWRSRAMAV